MDEKMEIRLVNPTEDGFLQKIDWNKAELEENVRSIVAAYQGLKDLQEYMKEHNIQFGKAGK